jgi:outer membrane protein OmpA-like peptidoglycan-associated protein
MGSMNRFRIFTFVSLLAVVAMPLPALALSAGDVTLGNIRVGANGTGTGTIVRQAADEELEAFDTSACNGFTIAPTPPADLPKTFTAADASLSFTASFTPAARTDYTCTVTMRGAGNSDLGTFQVTATGVAPVLSVSAATLTFGDVKVTGGTQAQTFNVLNEGDTGQTLSISSIATSGGANNDFTASPTAFTVASGASTLITVTFNPNATGGRTTTLVVTSDDPLAATESITLTGTGVEPMIATAQDPTNFGVVLVGSSSAPANIAVSNAGTGTLTVQSAAISGPQASWFRFTNAPESDCDNDLNSCDFNPDLTINGTAINVGIRCAPPAGASGAGTADLIFTSDTVGGDGQVTLNCTAGTPMILPNHAALLFGNVELNANGDITLEATNTGNETLTISSATFTNDQGGRYIVADGMTGNQTVAPNNKATWVLRCRTATLGDVGASTFRIVSNATNTPTLNIPASCRGGRLTTNRLTFAFGNVREGDTSDLTFTLANTGSDAISNITATFSNANAGYSVLNLPPSLAANASQNVTVRFNPANGDAGGNHTLTINGTYGAASATATQQMSLSGDGRTAAYSFVDTNDQAINALAFGNLRWDTTLDRTVKIVNLSESTMQITTANVQVTAPGTAMGELSRPAAFTSRALNPGQQILITVRANPADRLGALEGNLVVTSDLNTAMSTRQLPITANSVTPVIASNPANSTHNFGPVDVDQPTAVTQNLTLTNNGMADMGISGLATLTGGGGVIALVSQTGGSTLAPGATYTITVSYNPAAVAATNATITIPVTGVLVGTTMPMMYNFSLAGRGIDRTFSVADPGIFPETFRNPGSRAPIQEIVVTNTGEAPLNLGATMITGEPVWSLVEGEGMRQVAAGQTAAFKVRFAPTTGGKAPEGRLIISHDDDANGNRAEILLEGYGKNPKLSVAPASLISLGTTAVGFPVKLSELFLDGLEVENSDTATFKVRELKLRGSDGAISAFSVEDDLAGQLLSPGQSRNFDVEFAADEAGEFQAQLEIYLDEDTEPATIVMLTGVAVAVDVQGGGGCQAAGGGSWLWALGLGGLALFGLRRRRRRAAAMSVAVSAIALVLTAQTSQAQSTSRNLDLSTFRPAPSTTGELLHVESPFVGQRGDWELGLAISYLTNPLQVKTSMGDFNLVSQRTVVDLGVAFALAGRLELGARMATMNQSGDDEDMVRGLEPGVGTALGDALLHAKLQLVRGVALAVNATLPTATDDAFAGSGKFGGSGLVLLGLGNRRFSASANLGFGYQDKVILGNITQGNRALMGAGASFRATDKLTVTGEVFGAIAIGQRDRDGASPLEALAGVRYQATRVVGISLGMGTGIMRGIGAPALHGVLAFELAPNARAADPIRPIKPYVPPPDGDKDGIVDADDRCPIESEDLDGFRDLDGCPDPDNDFDGVTDGNDKCPETREDKDGIADDDGCPDVDDDGDNIPVPKDKCPDDREDLDGFEDDDGCPELDNDRDGIIDASDRCPVEAETINNNEDNDGCPDAGASMILLGRDRIDLVTPISFVGQTAKLTAETQGILAQVGATMRANPDIQRLRIGVHVNRRGAGDQPLSAKRAAALRDWLVQWGVEPHRLDIRGFGSTKLIVKAQRKDAAAINDRVELTIMQRGK